MATSPLFGWEEPDDTDLVKDGAAAIRTLGNAIDTSMGDLLGGTTGQVLKKNSNTDMDFVWSADSAGMTNPMTTTGDTIYSSSGSTPARLGIGTTGQVLTVSGGVPAWATPAGGGKVLQVVNVNYATAVSSTSITYADSGLTASITPSATTSKILVTVHQAWRSGASGQRIGAKLFRGSTELKFIGDYYGYSASAGDLIGGHFSISYLDSPATTSATTYKTQFNNGSASGTVTVQPFSMMSFITLMEIGA